MRGLDISAYLQQQRTELGRQTGLVQDFAVFDFNYVPAQPLIRDECKQLIREMLAFDLSGSATHFAGIGSRGSGKTLMVRYLQQVIPQQTGLEMLFVNCRHHNSSYKILAHFLGVRPRGASLGELYERFCAARKGRTVVVLDEVDLISPKDRHREILYLLSRSTHPFMLILLSNSPHVLKDMDAATRSSLQPVPLHFRNYDADQLEQILQQRAEEGLRSWETTHLAQIAALTAKRANSDARVAIKTLKYVVTSANQQVQSCFDRARRDVSIDLVHDLSDPNLQILWAVLLSQSDFAKDVHRKYSQLAIQQHERPFSYVHFHASLSYLQSCGLIALVSTKQGRTYANRVQLTVDSQMVREVCELRFAGNSSFTTGYPIHSRESVELMRGA